MRSNTFDPKLNMNKNPEKLHSEKDFETYSVQSKMSYQKQPPTTNNTVSNNQKMTKSILQALKKLYKDNQKNIYAAGFKPTQKTLLSTISTFINSFDYTFDQSTLTIQMIPEIYKGLGYPNTISKTYFQPVGAPHTWGQCLAMMEWLADLASFHADMRAFLEEQGSFQEDFTRILIRSYIENDYSIVKKYLDAQIERKTKAIQGFKYNISTMNMEIENQKAAQKSLKELDEEQKILEQILYRQTQEAIQIQHQNTELEKKLKDLRNRVKQQEMLNQIHQNQILSLTSEVQNQQLSVEQVQKIKYQIKETRQKLTQLRKFEQRQKQILDKTDETIINDYLEFNKTLEALRHMYRKHKYEMDIRNIYMDIPDCDVTKFRDFIKNRTQECTDIAVEEILGINQINDLKEKADTLLNLVDQEMISLDENKQLISAENQKLNEQCLQKEMQNSEQEMKLSSMKSKMNGIQYEIQTVQMQINHLIASIKVFDNNIQTLHQEENDTLDAAQRLVREVTEWGEINKTLKPSVNEAVEKMGMELIDLKVEIIEKVSEIAQSMQEFNKDMGFSWFVQKRNEQKMKGQNPLDLLENQEENREEGNSGDQEERDEQNDDAIEVMRRDFWHCADEQDDYMSLLGKGVYQSPKPEKVNRMLQRGFRP